ncbi:MAG: histidine phosphatase family protein [Candidatus Berkelbacteria bacterium]|nr:MAG: histidine phosphatase family protein [Candidatus Berkelbacteria bacterium]QQG51801.1 MAG: histidine phosphatase family protein [Candidatus Berkelbacteria bacterium]
MRIYFIRHGKSVLNESGIHQGPETPLSAVGKEQASYVARRLKHVVFEQIISSDMDRAKETAEIIHRETGVPLEITPLARERNLPKEFHGKPHDDPTLAAAKAEIEKNIRNPDFRHSDEETFFDLKDRAKKLVTFLEGRKEKAVVVVLHGTILRYVLATMAYGDDLDWDRYIGLAKLLQLNNTGITVCEQQEGRWKLITWNDHAHLGEVN